MRGRITLVDYNSDWALKERAFHPRSTPGFLTREDVIAFYGTLDVDGIELMHAYWDDYSPARLKQLTDDAGLPIVAYILFFDLARPPAERRPVLDDVFALIDRTAELGAPFAMVVPAVIKEHLPLDQQRAWLIDGLRVCAEHARSVGVTLLAENIDYPPLRPLMGRGADCRDLCVAVDSPAFRLIYDCATALFVEEDSLETLRVMGPHIAHVHVKNVRPLAAGEQVERFLDSAGGRRYTGTRLDVGLVDIRPILAELDRLDYDGGILLEYQGEDDPRDALRQSVAYLRSELATMA